MKKTYIARVVWSRDGWYAIDFPDLSGTHAQCRNIEDVRKEAEDSLCSFLLAAENVGEEIKAPSAKVELKGDEMAVIVTVDTDAYKRMLDSKPVRKTVSLPQWMAEKADSMGISLSKALQETLTERMAN